MAQPGTPDDSLLAAYADLTEQLGGEFVTLTAPSPAPALAEYASKRQATELVLSRTHPSPAGRHPVLRELAKLAADVELHVLPAEDER
jgi:K+-sensing histidine kinase KdpD